MEDICGYCGRTAGAFLIAALVLVAGGGSGSAGGPPGRAHQMTRAIGGIAAGGVEPWNVRRPADYAAMRTAGLTWLRTDLDWRFLEPARGTWNWPLYDPVVRDAKAAGLHTLGILHTTPAWANHGAGDHAPPADPALLTEYCYRTAKHYLPRGVTAYEIGNEVNLPGAGRPRPDGAAYTRKVLLPCVAGVRRAAAKTGLHATVILGSLVPTDRGRTVPETLPGRRLRRGRARPLRRRGPASVHRGGQPADQRQAHRRAGPAAPGDDGARRPARC